MTIDPALPAPDGVLAVRTVAHKHTTCEHVSSAVAARGCRPA